MREFQLVNLADLALVGDPVPLPPEFANLSDAVLSDFSAHIDPPPVGYAGKGLFPLLVSPPVLDPATEADTGVLDPSSRTVDAAARVVRGVSRKRPLTAEEIAARQPPPATIGKVEFITLAQLAGGMTDDMLVEAHANPLFAAFWIKFQMASVVDRDNAITKDSLTALAQAGYLPNGEAAVRAAWPNA